MTIYCHLSPKERAVIMIERNNHSLIQEIARILNRSASTISRELKRNSVATTSVYCAKSARKKYDIRRKTCVKPIKLADPLILPSCLSQYLFGSITEEQNYATKWLWFYNIERSNQVNEGFGVIEKRDDCRLFGSIIKLHLLVENAREYIR